MQRRSKDKTTIEDLARMVQSGFSELKDKAVSKKNSRYFKILYSNLAFSMRKLKT